MSTAVKRKLSGSTDGKPILLTTIQTPGVTIHTAIAGTTAGTYDEIWLWAYNGHTSDLVLTIEFGGYTVPDQNIVMTIPYKAGLVPVVPGFILQNGLLVSAFASQANLITLSGFVNSIAD